jgi:uncharacterized membrane protein YgcG
MKTQKNTQIAYFVYLLLFNSVQSWGVTFLFVAVNYAAVAASLAEVFIFAALGMVNRNRYRNNQGRFTGGGGGGNNSVTGSDSLRWKYQVVSCASIF